MSAIDPHDPIRGLGGVLAYGCPIPDDARPLDDLIDLQKEVEAERQRAAQRAAATQVSAEDFLKTIDRLKQGAAAHPSPAPNSHAKEARAHFDALLARQRVVTSAIADAKRIVIDGERELVDLDAAMKLFRPEASR